MHACLCWYECIHVLVCVYVYVIDCLYFCICVYIVMYIYVYVYMDGFISLKIMPFLFFLNFLSEKFQQCTKVKCSKVYTSASTFFKINL